MKTNRHTIQRINKVKGWLVVKTNKFTTRLRKKWKYNSF